MQGVAAGNVVPWRDAGSFPSFQFRAEGYTPANGEEWPHARIRMVTPGFFAVLGVPLLVGRDFTDDDHGESDPVVIVSESIAQRLFPNRDALNRRLSWTESGPPFGGPSGNRIVGVVADVDDENVVPGPAMTVYHPMRQVKVAGRLFVHAKGDPYALVPQVTRVIHEMAAGQPVERAATLEDVRAEVLAPDRVNTLVITGFAGVALLIAVVGVAGVLAFSVSARTREFGVRLAIGSTPRQLLVSRASGGRADHWDRDRRGRRRRIRVREHRGQHHPGGASARCAAPPRCGGRPGGRGYPGVIDARRTGVAYRRVAGAAVGVTSNPQSPGHFACMSSRP